MTVVNSAITAVVALLGVLLGGYLSLRNQDRLWARDHARQWRDIRLAAYKDFLDAYRQYVAYSIEPTANITATPHPRYPNLLLPAFDEFGRPYKERLDAATAAAWLVADSTETIKASQNVVFCARDLAAARALHSPTDIPAETFERFFAAQQALLLELRRDLGLGPISVRL